jgi:hypothetical protein
MKLAPQEPLQTVLEKICVQRGGYIFLSLAFGLLGLLLDDYVPRDMKGEIIPLNTVLCKIEGGEITFTEKGMYYFGEPR